MASKEESPMHERTESMRERRREGEKKTPMKMSKKPTSRMMMSSKSRGSTKY